ncbi:MAG: flavoprotein, partial [Pseudonocardiaceae bacterium]
NQLAELTGLGVRIVVLPFVNQGLAANQVFLRSIEGLRQAGVRVLFGPGEFEPHPPHAGGTVLDSYPWQRALDATQ